MNNFQNVYDLHLMIQDLAQSLTYYNMQDVFQIIPESTLVLLNIILEVLFSCQADEERTKNKLEDNLTDMDLQRAYAAA